MIKIWGKIISNERVINSKTIVVDEQTTSFFDMLKKLCEALSIPTPVLIDKHVYDFNLFNICTFKSDDFVENINFEKLTLEHLSE